MAQLCLRHADRAVALVLDDAVNDRGLAMTSSFTNMVLAGQCVGHLEDFCAVRGCGRRNERDWPAVSSGRGRSCGGD